LGLKVKWKWLILIGIVTKKPPLCVGAEMMIFVNIYENIFVNLFAADFAVSAIPDDQD
jgi:hypothetical protein